MPGQSSVEPATFDFAVIRVMPRVECQEFLNAGVILFCLEHKFLKSLVHLDTARLNALDPELDSDFVERHLNAYPRVCAADPDAGPIAALSIRERFHWLVSPRSTVIQISPVHSGLCVEPEKALHDLYRRLVAAKV